MNRPSISLEAAELFCLLLINGQLGTGARAGIDQQPADVGRFGRVGMEAQEFLKLLYEGREVEPTPIDVREHKLRVRKVARIQLAGQLQVAFGLLEPA